MVSWDHDPRQLSLDLSWKVVFSCFNEAGGFQLFSTYCCRSGVVVLVLLRVVVVFIVVIVASTTPEISHKVMIDRYKNSLPVVLGTGSPSRQQTTKDESLCYSKGSNNSSDSNGSKENSFNGRKKDC